MTAEEIQSLAQNDPEQFDADAFHAECEAREEVELTATAIEMGIPGNLTLAKYIRNMERDLILLHCYIDDKFRTLAERDDWQR